MRRLLALTCFALLAVMAFHIAETRAFGIYYISFSTGSNSNPGTKASPWKTHPFMKNTVTACSGTGSGPSYSPTAGDQFIFMGGDSWPPQCFGMTITSGGTSGAQNSYTTCGGQSTAPTVCGGATWPSTGWTRPKFDMAGNVVSTAAGFQVIYAANPGPQYVTFDNIEILNQGIGGLSSPISSNSGNQCAIGFGNTNSVDYAVGTIVENVYIHAAVTSLYTGTKLGTGQYPGSGYCASGIDGIEIVQNSELNGEDSSNGGTTPTASGAWAFFEGGVLDARVVQFTKIHGTISGCDQLPKRSSPAYSCHDNELYHMGNAGESDTSVGIHGHVVFDNQTASDWPSPDVYNNRIHDNNTGLNVRVNSIANVYNNVITDNGNNVPLYVQCWRRFLAPPNNTPCPTGDTVNIYNNTMTPFGSGACLNSTGTMGIVNAQNNICIGGGGLGTVTAATNNFSNNKNMGTAEANSFGFTAARLYAPSSSDSAVVGTGLNLTAIATGDLAALMQDPEGTAWYGGTAQARLANTGTGTCGGTPSVATPCWTMGAFTWPIGSSGTPSPIDSFSPASLTFATQTTGTSSSPQTVTLTNTGTASDAISGFSFVGANASQFSETTDCPSALSAGASCHINVTFSPTTAGSLTASLSVTDTVNPTGAAVVSLSGTGQAPGLWSHVSSSTAPGKTVSGTTCSVTLASTPASGSTTTFEVVAKNSNNTAAGAATVQDGSSNSFTSTPGSPSANATGEGQVSIFYLLNTPGGASPTITATFGATVDEIGCWAQNEQVASGYNAVFDANVAGTGTGTAINTPSFTPALAQEHVVVASTTAFAIVAVGSPWTDSDNIYEPTTGAPFGFVDGWVENQTSAVNPNMTNSTSVGWSALNRRDQSGRRRLDADDHESVRNFRKRRRERNDHRNQLRKHARHINRTNQQHVDDVRNVDRGIACLHDPDSGDHWRNQRHDDGRDKQQRDVYRDAEYFELVRYVRASLDNRHRHRNRIRVVAGNIYAHVQRDGGDSNGMERFEHKHDRSGDGDHGKRDRHSGRQRFERDRLHRDAEHLVA